MRVLLLPCRDSFVWKISHTFVLSTSKQEKSYKIRKTENSLSCWWRKATSAQYNRATAEIRDP